MAPERDDELGVLSQYIARTEFDDLPREAIARARCMVAEALPVISLGMHTPEMQRLAERKLAARAQGESSVIGFARRTSADIAALLNGLAGARVEQANEIVPAVLAIAEQRRASGRLTLAALVLGYEAAARVSSDGANNETSTVIGAAVAAAKLSKLEAEAMRELIAIAASLGTTYRGTASYGGILALDLAHSEFNDASVRLNVASAALGADLEIGKATVSTDEALSEKFSKLSEQLWTERQAKAIFEDAMSLERVGDMHTFFTRHSL